MEDIRRVWEDHDPSYIDPRRRWREAWTRVKQWCKQQKTTGALNLEALEELRNRVGVAREELLPDVPEQTLKDLADLEQRLEEMERREADLWRKRSRTKWLAQGEAPTKFFFSHAKANFTREMIHGLEDSQRGVITAHSELLSYVHGEYSDLYNAQVEGRENRLARQSITQLVDKALSSEEAGRFDEVPQDEEIEKTVKLMKIGRAPGLDGVTVEFILKCWAFIRTDCCKMVRAFWSSKSMLERDVRGCIKLIPKTEERQHLKNWRPVTLMSCTYKIISKLLAGRLRKHLPHLVDLEQTGFVPGRRIEDNVLTLKMAEEWSRVSAEENLFVKLDFSKAFDRDFMEPVKIKKGVRQGCPLAPLLFALSTQPLMRALKEAERTGEWKGLRLPNLRFVTHELFADDTSVFISATAGDFRKVKTVIEHFELASGAVLNMQKSLVLALGRSDAPEWVRGTDARWQMEQNASNSWAFGQEGGLSKRKWRTR
ncbi:hypothetical protein R1sor_000371 [Riccia sorocarpa]|uniref:Reverse transcriptase domain-containing protein n=1 Tax=Riccia sorocarpa TaxID=122646 RepID=A0ABD3GVE1_9MARC